MSLLALDYPLAPEFLRGRSTDTVGTGAVFVEEEGLILSHSGSSGSYGWPTASDAALQCSGEGTTD